MQESLGVFDALFSHFIHTSYLKSPAYPYEPPGAECGEQIGLFVVEEYINIHPLTYTQLSSYLNDFILHCS